MHDDETKRSTPTPGTDSGTVGPTGANPYAGVAAVGGASPPPSAASNTGAEPKNDAGPGASAPADSGADTTPPPDAPSATPSASGAKAANEPPGASVKGGDEALQQRIISTLRTCYDPEIPVDIWELGLIYSVDIDDDSNVAVQMTLTSPMCPVAGSLPPEVERKMAAVEGVRDARVDLVWEPMWQKEMMSEAAMVRLNLM